MGKKQDSLRLLLKRCGTVADRPTLPFPKIEDIRRSTLRDEIERIYYRELGGVLPSITLNLRKTCWDIVSAATQNSDPVTGKRRGRIENLKPWPKGVSGNPGGKPKVDLAAEIARAIFQNDAEAIYRAYSRMLRKGSAYCFQVLSDRAFGKLKESIQHEISPFANQSEEELLSRVRQLERELGVPPQLPRSVDDD